MTQTDVVSGLHLEMRNLVSGMVECNKTISERLKGCTIEIVSNFNDQPHGRSKPSLKGKRYKVKGAAADLECGGRIVLWCEGLWCLPTLVRDAVIVEDR